jgi:DeoR family transcriptional regulator, fructose operon transcriptional repressor
MFAPERQAQILERARSQGRVEVAALAAHLDVTPETVRRDLKALQDEGLLQRVHGGAVLAESRGFEPTLAVREVAQTEQKARIARAALELLPTTGAIALDGGSTIHRFAEILPADSSLTVITNNLAVALPLAEHRGLTVHIVGGRLRGGTLTTVDEVALAYLGGVGVDVVFLGTNGFSLTRGLTTPDSAEAAVKRALIAAARQRVLLTDSTKFGWDHFAHVAALSEIDVIITDTDLAEEDAARIELAGPRVLRT